MNRSGPSYFPITHFFKQTSSRACLVDKLFRLKWVDDHDKCKNKRKNKQTNKQTNKQHRSWYFTIILSTNEIFKVHLTTNAGFNSTCYHPPPGTPPVICNFFLTWRSIPHPRASRKRQFPTPGTPHRPQIRCFVFKIDFRTIGQPDVLTRT